MSSNRRGRFPRQASEDAFYSHTEDEDGGVFEAEDDEDNGDEDEDEDDDDDDDDFYPEDRSATVITPSDRFDPTQALSDDEQGFDFRASALRSNHTSHSGSRPRPAQSTASEIVVISSDEEGDIEVSQPIELPPEANPRDITVPNSAAPSNASGVETATVMDTDPDESAGGFQVERVIRSAPRPSAPIEIYDDGILEEANAAGISPNLTAKSHSEINGLRMPHASPPKGKAPLVAHPLLSKYNCPICLCAPYPHVVATPCGHLFCSECLFAALQNPIKQKQSELREQAAAFASFSNRGTGHAAGFMNALFGAASGFDAATMAAVEAAETDAAAEAAASGLVTPTTDPASSTDSNSGSRGGRGGRRGGTASGHRPGSSGPKLDPLVGVCPVCRAKIPGGFLALKGTPAAKRSVFGLELKLGKPIDDPRRDV